MQKEERDIWLVFGYGILAGFGLFSMINLAVTGG